MTSATAPLTSNKRNLIARSFSRPLWAKLVYELPSSCSETPEGRNPSDLAWQSVTVPDSDCRSMGTEGFSRPRALASQLRQHDSPDDGNDDNGSRTTSASVERSPSPYNRAS